jgi:hypothetical protein
MHSLACEDWEKVKGTGGKGLVIIVLRNVSQAKSQKLMAKS